MMPSLPQILVIALVVLLLFGGRKIPDFMANLAKGIKSFKKGMAEDEPLPTHSNPKVVDVEAVVKAPATKASSKTKTSGAKRKNASAKKPSKKS